MPAKKPVTVAGHTIGSGLVYVGTGLNRSDGYGTENCLINPTLEVSSSATNDGGANVPYWPSYAHLDPPSRLSLLKWLAEGKGDPSIYIGYVFIYFYGLERRLMLEDADDEAPVIVDEVKRLLSLFHDNHSFSGYASQLLGAAAFKYGLPVVWPAPRLRKTSWQLPLDLRVCVGRAIAAGQPLTADQMLAWYGAHPGKRLPPQASHCPQEFLALYTCKFKSQYPNGLTVPAPERRLTGDYRAASSTFTVQLNNKGSAIPDVTGIVAPLNTIEPLIAACADRIGFLRQIFPQKVVGQKCNGRSYRSSGTIVRTHRRPSRSWS